MKDRKLDHLFDRFRKRGDSAALAQVFDATAPELLGIAVHLVRDVGEAEDLLQQTFLTAIEKAERYDAQRRLVPWLVGILVRHAHNARRTRARAQASEITDLPGGDDPTGGAEVNELSDSIQAALRGLPATYRAVLEPYLLRGERAVDIARANGTAPGTVRVQIRRGLDELRRALPAGLTLGTGVLLGGRSLADVRGTVLDAAAKFAKGQAPLTATSLSSSTLFGSLVMSNKLILGALALAAFSVLAWFAQRDDAASVPGLAAEDRGTDIARAEPDAGKLPRPATGSTTANAQTASERSEVAQPAADVEQLAPFMASAHGQIVDESNQPLAGIRVQLLQLRPDMFEALADDVFNGEAAILARDALWNPLVDEAVTDAEGRFTVGGASPLAAQALGIDVGGVRPSLRVIDSSLQSGKDTSLGVIQLEPVHTVTGTVLDADGSPVAGARVRAAAIPPSTEFLMGFRPGIKMLSSRGVSPVYVVTISGAAIRFLELYPLPSTRTDQAGHFELSGVPAIPQSIYVDTPGRQPLSQRVLATQEVCDTLGFPARLQHSGSVVEADGKPIAGAQVVFGGTNSAGESKFDFTSDGECTTDSNGSFTFSSEVSPAVFARRDPSDPWTLQSGFQDGDRVVLEPRQSATLKLTDRDGNAIGGAQVYVASSLLVRTAETSFGVPPRAAEVREIDAGIYEIRGVPPGEVQLRVRADGFASLDRPAEFEAPGERLELQMDRSLPREIRVLDAQTKAPIAGAVLRAPQNPSRRRIMAQATTGRDGLATIKSLPSEGEHQLSLRISHPGYGLRTVEIPTAVAGPIEVRLDSASEALFRVTVEGRQPPISVSIQITPGRSQSYRPPFPHMQVTDLHGAGLFERLASGDWTYEITERYWDTNVMTLFEGQLRSPVLAQGTFTIREGLREIIDVDLAADNFEEYLPSTSGGIEGRITVNASIELHLKVVVRNANTMASESEFVPLSPDGHYRFANIGRGSYKLYVLHWPDTATQALTVAASEFEVRQDRMVQHDLQIDGTTFEVATVDEQGSFVNDATILAFSMNGEPIMLQGAVGPATGGVQTVTVWQRGAWMLMVNSPSAGLGRRNIEVGGSEGEMFTVHLTRGVPCAGTLTLPGSTYTGAARLNAYAVDDTESAANVDIQLTSGVGTFDIVGLVPAALQGRLRLPDGSGWSIEFELPEGGDDALEIEAEPLPTNGR